MKLNVESEIVVHPNGDVIISCGHRISSLTAKRGVIEVSLYGWNKTSSSLQLKSLQTNSTVPGSILSYQELRYSDYVECITSITDIPNQIKFGFNYTVRCKFNC